MNKKCLVLLVCVIILCISACKNETGTKTVNLIGTIALEDTDPAYAEIMALLEHQHELEFFMETQWERKEGLDTWEDFETYAQEVYTKEYVDQFFTPKYFGENNPYYYLDEEGSLTRRETDGIVFGILLNTPLKMKKPDNAYAAIQELEADNGAEYRIYLIVHTEKGFKIYAQIEE